MKFTIEASAEKNKKINAESDEYPCLSVYLPIMQQEYEREQNRTDRIDGKISALLTILIALITVYIPIYPFETIIDFYSGSSNCCFGRCLYSLFLLMGFGALILSVYSAYKLIGLLKAQEYKAVDIEKFRNNSYLNKHTIYPLQMELICHYLKIILINSDVNTTKAKTLNNQFRNVIFIFVLISISAIGTLIISGIS